MNILTINLLFSTLVFGIAAKLYLMPALSRLEPRSVVVPILLLHAMRHLGLMFLAPGAVFPGIPQQFTYPAALGDLLTAVLALIAILPVIRSSPLARPLVGLFNVVGTLDLIELSLAPLSTTPRCTWGQRIGYLPSGFRRSSSPTLSCLSFWVGAGMGRCEQSEARSPTVFGSISRSR
jgi:hypothetical protein